MDRETKILTTPGGHKVVVRTYLTGRESNELKSLMFSALKIKMDDAATGAVNVPELPGTFLLEQEQKALGMIIVSVDDETSGVVEKMLDWPQSEYKFVVDEVNKITNPSQPVK